ncbi:hypothetical protein CAPTEDRAFT_197304 [Capitella teleta]|uniref:F5/8 type C domain-containing protein n=1 Tax=Capitella teleta TaxID=283909 RepID=R7TV78_CAPTE|nr:hypothetical protein CAPTEDRAFT_197304 [Capitella teleta]|eukprot:ELT95356.1 hypothetical protein CAPTEDRAFT_197304 [Capitella teleta]
MDTSQRNFKVLFLKWSRWTSYFWPTLYTDSVLKCKDCRADQDLWVTFKPSWNLSVNEDHILDFLSHPSVLTEYHLIQRTELYERDYYIRYGGAAVQLTYTETTDSAAILNEQYLQIDLESQADVAGLKIQAGFYEDAGDVLFFRRSSWLTYFMVSFTTNNIPEGFNYITDDSGNPQVFYGTSDAISSELVSFDETVTARYIRIHPITAYDDEGETTNAMFRASLVTCMTDDVCYNPRVNCILYEWQSWSQCSCVNEVCAQWRVRGIAHHSACGGTECEHTKEGRSCLTVESTLKQTIIWVVIVIVLLIVIALIIYLLVRLYKKKRDARRIFDKTNSKKIPTEGKNKKQEDKKEVKSAKEGLKDDVIEEEKVDEGATERQQSGEFNEFDESILTPRAVAINESAPKASTPKQEKKKKKKGGKKTKAEKNSLDDSGITTADESMKADHGNEQRKPLPAIGGVVELPALRGEPSLRATGDWDDEFEGIFDESKA